MGRFLGIVDFGIGGLSVYKRVRQLSNMPVLYFADSGGTPYGETEPSLLRERLDRIFNFLFEKGAAKVVIACNSASAVYEDTDRVSGIINDGVAALAKGGWKKIGLIAGRGTVETGAYARRLDKFPIELTERIAQPLSAHVEAGRLDGVALHKDLQEILSPLRAMEAVLLACTHYPAIAPQIKRYVDKDCVLVDPADEMAQRIVASWNASQPAAAGSQDQSQGDLFFTSGDAEQFQKCGGLAFDLDLPMPQRSPV